jgi:hypothetical protein
MDGDERENPIRDWLELRDRALDVITDVSQDQLGKPKRKV